MRRFAAGPVLILIATALSAHAHAQQRYDSGPYKGFVKEAPPLDVTEIERPFKVRAIRGTLIFGDSPLADAFFEVRDISGRVFTAKTDQQGTFKVPDAKPGRYDFKATKDGFRSVMGTVVVSDGAPHKNRIRVQLALGT